MRTIRKACGDEITFGHLERHLCRTPKAAYETERDKYRAVEADRRARYERLGIEQIPSLPIWVELEVFLNGGRVLRYVTLRDNFQYVSGRLTIESLGDEDWSVRIMSSQIESYRFREFADEPAALAALNDLRTKTADIASNAAQANQVEE